MSIDEAIAHAKEKAHENKERAKHFDTVDNKNMCLEFAEEHAQLAEWLIQLKEYQNLEEQGRLIKLPLADDKVEHRECVHTKATCNHEECKCSECPLTELFLVLRRGLCK